MRAALREALREGSLGSWWLVGPGRAIGDGRERTQRVFSAKHSITRNRPGGEGPGERRARPSRRVGAVKEERATSDLRPGAHDGSSTTSFQGYRVSPCPFRLRSQLQTRTCLAVERYLPAWVLGGARTFRVSLCPPGRPPSLGSTRSVLPRSRFSSFHPLRNSKRVSPSSSPSTSHSACSPNSNHLLAPAPAPEPPPR